LYPLGVDTAKDVIYGRLDLDEHGPGFCHFPQEYPDEYFKQLTSEEKVKRFSKGVVKTIWKKKRARNEALDIRVYNLAALMILNPNFTILKRRADDAEASAKDDAAAAAATEAETAAAAAAAATEKAGHISKAQNKGRPGRSKGGFVGNW
jgi:phage terminase large subunit GpA-like protein